MTGNRSNERKANESISEYLADEMEFKCAGDSESVREQASAHSSADKGTTSHPKCSANIQRCLPPRRASCFFPRSAMGRIRRGEHDKMAITLMASRQDFSSVRPRRSIARFLELIP